MARQDWVSGMNLMDAEGRGKTLARRSRAPRYGRLIGLGWLHFLNDGSANYLPGVLPAVLLALHQSVTLAGGVMAALLIGQALQVPSGWLADHFGGRLFIVCGVVGTAVAAAFIGLAPGMVVLVPALVVIGICNSLFHPQSLAAARMLSGDRPGLGMSFFLVGGELGRGVWPLIASLVVVHFGLGYLWLLALPALFSIALLWRRLPMQTPRHVDAEPIAWRRHLAPMSLVVAFQALRALGIFGATTYLPLLWEARGHDLTEGAGLITVLLVVGIVGNVGGGHLADRVGRTPVLLGSSLLGALLVALFLTTAGAVQWLALGMLGIALFASLPIGILLGQDLFPENRSLGSGMALGLGNGLAALGLAAFGPVAAEGGPEAAMWLLSGVMLAAAFVSLFLRKRVAGS